jgi:hypothetical protein
VVILLGEFILDLNTLVAVFKKTSQFPGYTLWGTLKIPAGTKGTREFIATLKDEYTFVPMKQTAMLKPADIKAFKGPIVVFETLDQIDPTLVPILNSRCSLRILKLQTTLTSHLPSLELSYAKVETN